MLSLYTEEERQLHRQRWKRLDPHLTTVYVDLGWNQSSPGGEARNEEMYKVQQGDDEEDTARSKRQAKKVAADASQIWQCKTISHGQEA